MGPLQVPTFDLPFLHPNNCHFGNAFCMSSMSTELLPATISCIKQMSGAVMEKSCPCQAEVGLEACLLTQKVGRRKEARDWREKMWVKWWRGCRQAAVCTDTGCCRNLLDVSES